MEAARLLSGSNEILIPHQTPSVRTRPHRVKPGRRRGSWASLFILTLPAHRQGQVTGDGMILAVSVFYVHLAHLNFFPCENASVQ